MNFNTGAAQVRVEAPLRAASSVAVALGCLALLFAASLLSGDGMITL